MMVRTAARSCSLSKLLSAAAALLMAAPAWAAPLQAPMETPDAAHGDPVAGVILSLAVILIAAKFGGHLAAKVRPPAGLGGVAGRRNHRQPAAHRFPQSGLSRLGRLRRHAGADRRHPVAVQCGTRIHGQANDAGGP